MAVVTSIPVLDQLLEARSDLFGADLVPYRNHNYRVANFCVELAGGVSDEQLEKIGIACAFHDIGVWTHKTLDYLEPSRDFAQKYLADIGKAEWAPEIEAMVVEHHKIRGAGASAGPLVEPFRKADWIDVSLGMLKFGLPSAFVSEVRTTFPNAGFHKLLMRAAGRQLRTDPLRPMPMMRF
jgi:hypothetical protein